MHVDMPRPVSLFELRLFKAKMVYALVEFGLADGCVGITLATATKKTFTFQRLHTTEFDASNTVQVSVDVLGLFRMVVKGPRLLPACGLRLPAQEPQDLLPPIGKQGSECN